LATDNLIGEKDEKIFQIRMQEIIARYSNTEKFPSVVILPDTKARPMGMAIKDVFYYLTEVNNFPKPQVVFVASPKISKNNRPDSNRQLFDQYGIIVASHLVEMANTNFLDANAIKTDPYTGRYLTGEDRLNMHTQLLSIRNTISE
jgi:hypothetical protein